MSRKSQQELAAKALRDLLAQPGNKKCLECDQRGPTYVDITIGSFVCTSCGGMLRGLNPPHRVKSISMTNFTTTEITFMQDHGNEWCRAVYLAKYDEHSGIKPESKDQAKLKHFMELKYEQKRWYESPAHQQKLLDKVTARAKKTNENTKATSRPAANTSQAKLKPVSAPTKQPTANLLDGLSFPSQQPVAPQNTAPKPQASASFPGFADFDRAFAELATSQSNTSNQPDPFAAFQVSSQPIDFTNTTMSKPSNGLSGTTATQDKSTDKYAALLDLDLAFNKPDNTTTKNETPFFSMPSNSMATSGLSQPASMGPYSGMPSQQMSNSTFAANSTFSGYNPLPPDTSSNFGTTPNWNTPFTNTNYPSYQNNPPTVAAPVASATNPFFSTTQQQAPPMQNWTNQYQMHQTPRPANSTGIPSTNPFNIGGQAVPAGNAFNMSQPTNPVQNSSNPFLFS